MEEKDIIDFGEWTVPSSWDEVSLEQMHQLQLLYKQEDKSPDFDEVVSIFTGKNVDEIKQLPYDFYETILAHLSFLDLKLPKYEPSNSVVLDGDEYIANTQETLKAGEYMAAEAAIHADSTDYPTILAIVLRKKGEKFDSHFENEVLPERIEFFKQVPAIKVMPVVNFFLIASLISSPVFHTYIRELEEEVQSLNAKK